MRARRSVAARFQRSRPLWEMWFLPGLPDGRVGLFMKMHHAIADGVAGVATLGAFVDTEPDPPETDRTAMGAGADATGSDLLGDNLRRRRQGAERAISALATRSARFGAPGERGRRCVKCSRRDARPSGRASTVGSAPDRRLAIIRSNLGLAKEIAHTHHAKVNDVLLTAVARGYRALSGERMSASRTLSCVHSFRCRCTRRAGRGTGKRRRRDGGAASDR